jgi:hypothetical protein
MKGRTDGELGAEERGGEIAKDRTGEGEGWGGEQKEAKNGQTGHDME